MAARSSQSLASQVRLPSVAGKLAGILFGAHACAAGPLALVQLRRASAGRVAPRQSPEEALAPPRPGVCFCGRRAEAGIGFAARGICRFWTVRLCSPSHCASAGDGQRGALVEFSMRDRGAPGRRTPLPETDAAIAQAPAVMTVDEVAEYLRIPRLSAYELAQRGGIPSQKLGRHRRLRRGAVDRCSSGTRRLPPEDQGMSSGIAGTDG